MIKKFLAATFVAMFLLTGCSSTTNNTAQEGNITEDPVETTKDSIDEYTDDFNTTTEVITEETDQNTNDNITSDSSANEINQTDMKK